MFSVVFTRVQRCTLQPGNWRQLETWEKWRTFVFRLGRSTSMVGELQKQAEVFGLPAEKFTA